MDKVSFEIIFESLPEESFSQKQLAIQGTINNQIVVSWKELPIDILELVDTTKGSGDYFIWTCTCGIPECGGIKQGVKVVIENNLVKWIDNKFPLDKYSNLIFDKNEYVSSILLIWQNYIAYYKSYKSAKIDFELCPNLRYDEFLKRIPK